MNKFSLIILALLVFSCNSSDEEMYQVYIEQNKNNLKVFNHTNKINYLLFDLDMKDKYIKQKVSKYYKTTHNLKRNSDSIIYQIQSILSEEKENINNTELLILKKKYQIYKNNVNEVLDSLIHPKQKKNYIEFISIINNLLNTTPWERINCLRGEKSLKNEISASLLKLELDIKTCETQMLNFLYWGWISGTGNGYYGGDFQTFTNPYFQVVKQNEICNIEFLFGIDSHLQHSLKTKNGVEIVFKQSNGNYKINTFELGNFTDYGSIDLENPVDGKMFYFPFEIKYEVIDK
jgi:hypothetical protein